MDYRDDSGATKRSHLDKVWDQTNIKPVDYLDVEIPEAGTDLYVAFWDLYKSDGIRWEDLFYYGQYTDVWFNGEEVRILRTLDQEAHKWISKREKAKQKHKPAKK